MVCGAAVFGLGSLADYWPAVLIGTVALLSGIFALPKIGD